MSLERAKTNFSNFLELHRVYKNSPFTHTRVGRNEFGGKYNIPDNELDNFYKLYAEVLKNIPKQKNNQHTFLNFMENQKDKKVGPLMLDFDFKFDITQNKRKYTQTLIKNIISIINKIILNNFKYNGEKPLTAYLFEKDSPTEKRDKETNEIKCFKDGFHICYILPFTQKQRQYIYRLLYKECEEKKIFDNLGCINKLNEI